MSSPQGIYVGMSLVDLEAERLLAIDRIRSGDRISLSGAGKSSGRNFSLSASDELREILFAIEQLSGRKPARFNFSPVPLCGRSGYGAY